MTRTALALLTLATCAPRPHTPARTPDALDAARQTYHLTPLFRTRAGCVVSRFTEQGEPRYVTSCPGTVGWVSAAPAAGDTAYVTHRCTTTPVHVGE